ncbi:type I-B CRISPR-associated protein Cas8b/Csh1 [Halonotius roseus]|uniref:Type I-B CRISPR-associated protein Cas8b/Csh1 n=1 Tax=Halonotius roseus TaxID=2511997 RepID=A0A544QQX8_9EURY|nr:type I-B CRISPR-associated protein Cas8b/Csh1 [Halonotius roseus]TQQ81831.1 type I-B CRISPR-associated protein Cas8b/Csh1 [Halonotius roseus]
MLSPDAFREKYPPEELEAELPDSPIGSLRDLQYLYGKLYTLATTDGGKYAPYLTPDAADDLLDTDDSLIVVRVDLSGDEPQLADDNRGTVWITRYTKDHIPLAAHCYYQNRGAGIDHSITHKSGQDKSPERLGEYAKHRFTRWPSEDAVQDLAENHGEGWIITDLNKIGENDELTEEIKTSVQRQIDGDQTSLITVKIKTESDGEFQWPSELEILMEGMRRQRLSKLVTKNKAKDSSGQAVDIVTQQNTRTVGTAQDPINYYLGKQVEKFPGLDIDEAWRSHPVSEDSALTLMKAEQFIETCAYRTFGAKVYYLPYIFGTPSAEELYELYTILHNSAVEDSDKTPIERAYERQQDIFGANRLRFYITAVMPHQNSRYDVFGETLNGKLHFPKELALSHNRLVKSVSAFNRAPDAEWTAPLPTNENWELLETNDNQLHSVSTGWYFYQTFAERDDDEADADDPRIKALVSVLSGDSLSVEMLLEEYVNRIIDDQTDDEEHEGFPSFLVASQFAQICALADNQLNLLKADDPSREPITQEPTYEKHIMPSLDEIPIADGGHPAAPKLESFINETPALSPANDDDPDSVTSQRRGAFLLGALVGDIGSYQEYSEDRSTTLVDQYPVKSITRSRIKKVTQETVAKTLTYTRQEKKQRGNYPGTKADHIVDRLRDTILKPDPEEWEIETDDLRFYYALGVTYGMNDHPWNREETDADDSTPEEEH